jgi:carboxymethylenebutenolidase
VEIEPRISKTDPRPPMLDYIQRVKVPVQFHYGMNDGLIPNEDLVKLGEKINATGRKPEIYIYEGAQHGFADMTDDTSHAEHAALAEKRWKKFLRKHL